MGAAEPALLVAGKGFRDFPGARSDRLSQELSHEIAFFA